MTSPSPSETRASRIEFFCGSLSAYFRDDPAGDFQLVTLKDSQNLYMIELVQGDDTRVGLWAGFDRASASFQAEQLAKAAGLQVVEIKRSGLQ